MSKSPIIPEHEHGLGTSGLRRIRQQPSTRTADGNLDPLALSRSTSLNLSLPPSRAPSTSLPSGSMSPTLNFSEDLSRFPSESLHSFSFAHQSEDFIHNRQNVLKRSIDFMRDKLGWAASNPGIASAQAKLSGDTEVQSMIELLSRANLIGKEAGVAHGLGALGPLTGPADLAGEGNVFDKAFLPRSESPESMFAESPKSLKSLPSPRSRHFSTSLLARLDTPSADANQVCADAETEVGISPTTTLDSMSKSTTTDSDGQTIPSHPSRVALKRTFTDTGDLSIKKMLTDALAQPYQTGDPVLDSTAFSPTDFQPPTQIFPPNSVPHTGPHTAGSAPHGHGSRWSPAAQAIFTTEAHSPWTITSANDLACLVFGVTRAEVRKIGILEVVREERRRWLEEKLRDPESGSQRKGTYSQSTRSSPNPTTSLNVGSGLTARLLNKPSSRATPKRRSTDDGSGSTYAKTSKVKGGLNHQANKSRGVLLCGDVVPIQKRNGALGSASVWVKEKHGGLIWVLEEIAEDVVYLSVDEVGCVVKGRGATEAIWGVDRVRRGMDVTRLIPDIPKLKGTNTGALDYERIAELKTYTARTSNDISIPCTVEQMGEDLTTFRISSFPHIAGIMVLSASGLKIESTNPVFSSALFGQPHPEGLHINDLIPGFDRILNLLTDEDKINLVDGIVIPEHSFRRARALLAMREGKADAAAVFLRPSGLLAHHRDGSEIMVDVQMRVVKSEKARTPRTDENVIEELSEEEENYSQVRGASPNFAHTTVYALWCTYSRHMHASHRGKGPVTPIMSRPGTPPRQPSPGQSVAVVQPDEMDGSDESKPETPVSLLSQQLKAGAAPAPSPVVSPGLDPLSPQKVNTSISTAIATGAVTAPPNTATAPAKKSINDFVVLEDMGQGAYGQVKLCRYKRSPQKRMVIKYVTKRRILVDTWTRDRRLGTVPLEIHVLDFLRRTPEMRHPNIVEMADFFEDDVNYYIEMIPHGLPGMDLFDYIELRANMEEEECKGIFVQVASALKHLHTKAKVVHRDVKDENVVLDGGGRVKIVDFGSAAYIRNGPFDVFVGTIDYAAPEVLSGHPYRGKEQDVWALGILLYTIIYKENPFYSIDEIMDHDLRVPWVMSEASIDLIRRMLDRDVERRISIGGVLQHEWCMGAVGAENTE
ncbi:Pkinase-domain-containing protein [Aulographum hederae CBS 113979]|uniref:non-specific serine/threonine protein kinase n=1 Tax=Aulographum hederae CBS 113979 TaxID=1176131 RepID=A0A6G1H175_9PEZI|nr:Pkinase-domain-containing protein [Aulographum hederae CBS 113979]